MKKEAYWSLSAVFLVIGMGCLTAILLVGFMFEGDPQTDITIREGWIVEGGFILFILLSLLFAYLGRKSKINAFKQNPHHYTLRG